MRAVITIDPIACAAYGYCAELLPELVTLDEWGYPVVDRSPVPRDQVDRARRAAKECPRRAFSLVTVTESRPHPERVDPSMPAPVSLRPSASQGEGDRYRGGRG